MIKTGSKLFYGFAGLALVAAVLYTGFTGNHQLGMDSLIGPLTFGWKGYVGEHVGYAILMGVAVTSLALGVFFSVLRDSDAETGARLLGVEHAPPASEPVSTNYWPVIGAFSFGCLALGLAVGPTLFVIGLIGFVITLLEWTVRAWADRATGDALLNRALRHQLLNPIELPLAGILVIAAIVLGMSRILLALPSVGSIIVFAAVPAIILGLGAVIALKPKVSPSVIAGLLVAGALALLIGGTIAAVHGERPHHSNADSGHEEGLAPLPTPAVHTIQVGS